MTFALSQSMRVAERSIATIFMPGSVTAYHLAFRIYGATQQVLAWSLATAGLSSLARSAGGEAGPALAASPVAELIADLSGTEVKLSTELGAALLALAVARSSSSAHFRSAPGFMSNYTDWLAKRRAQRKAHSSPPTHAEIAHRIGSHREAISRELKVLERAGLLEKKQRALLVPDLAALQRFIEDEREH